MALLKSARLNPSRTIPSSPHLRPFTTSICSPDKEHRSEKAQVVRENRELYLSVLSSTSTKREARSYLQRFQPSFAPHPTSPHPPPAILKYLKQSSFTQEDLKARNQTYVQRLHQNHPDPTLPQLYQNLFIPEITEEDIHVGLVKIRNVSAIDTPTLQGIGRTLTHLSRLGLFTAVIIDEPPSHSETWRQTLHTQADRVVSAIEHARGKARRIDGCISVAHETSAPETTLPNLLITPLSRGVIPVLPPIAYTATQRAVPVNADDLLLSLTALLSSHSPTGIAVDQPITLDRIIILDPLGGIPSHDRPSGAHVFINLEQEYTTLCTHLTSHNHLSNLSTLRSALSLLPPTSSALITTPSLAAAYSNAPGKNPLIHNLLTDKPLISSSLPITHAKGTLTTLLKHGIPVTTYPATRLTDPQINLPKLVALVEDSFGKKLDLEHYLKRVDGNMAALIVAGDYEGAAIVTWEYPEGGQRICYLDKFAVLRRSQGTGGVADVVFKSMVEGVRGGVFPGAEGIVWRSRRWNPVNKWYFERAKGTWKIPGSGWTMFWTTQDAEVGRERFGEYASVCGGIEPSLRDE